MVCICIFLRLKIVKPCDWAGAGDCGLGLHWLLLGLPCSVGCAAMGPHPLGGSEVLQGGFYFLSSSPFPYSQKCPQNGNHTKNILSII